MSLSYEITNWENGKTVLRAEHLRKIEKGITDIIAENDAIYKDEDTRKSNEKQRQEEHSRKMNEVSEVVSDIQKDYDSLQKIIIDENASANLQNQINQTNSQLEQKANKNELNLLSFNRYGDIDLPSDFYNNINFRIYRGVDGKINHNFNIDDVINGWRTIYISEDGNDANNGDTQDKPKKTLNSVFDKINAISENDVIIKILSPLLTRNNSNVSTTNRIINKNIAIVSDTETNISNL